MSNACLHQTFWFCWLYLLKLVAAHLQSPSSASLNSSPSEQKYRSADPKTALRNNFKDNSLPKSSLQSGDVTYYVSMDYPYTENINPDQLRMYLNVIILSPKQAYLSEQGATCLTANHNLSELLAVEEERNNTGAIHLKMRQF